MSPTSQHRHGRLRKHTKPGAPPGVLVAHDTARPTRLTAISYGPQEIEALEDANAEQALALRGRRSVLWIHIEGTRDMAAFRQLGDAFSLHGLALEDSVTRYQQVKVEEYENHLFLVTRMVPSQPDHGTRQLSVFIAEGLVITVTEEPSDIVDGLRPRLQDARSDLRRKGSDFLAYAILDLIVDQYFPLLERYGERLDDLEDRITDHPPREIIHEVHDIRVELRTMRRIVWRQRDAINVFLRGENPLFERETRVYLRDCHDHTIQLIELLEVAHETCSDLRDIYLSAISNRMNEIMMLLTVIATIFMPLSFIAGLYGMNFNTQESPFNMPELNWYLGYPFALALMFATAGGMLWFFRRRDWLR